MLNMGKLHQEHGEKYLGISPNGQIFILTSEDTVYYQFISLVRIYPEVDLLGDEASSKFSPTRTEKRKTRSQISPKIKITVLNQLNLEDYEVNDSFYKKMNKTNLLDVIKYYKSLSCSICVKTNDNLDLAFGFISSAEKGE